MVEANIEERTGRLGTQWVKTHAYHRLDPSEKSAVSYFLGMTQAKITCELLLGIPHLVHLDAVLGVLGHPTKASRPDFVGFDFRSPDYSIAVEAKGTSGRHQASVAAGAKAQARLLPSIVGTTSSLRIASVASFGAAHQWRAYLEDPPGSPGTLDSLTIGALLVAYYRPLVAALLAAGTDGVDSSGTAWARLPGIDVRLGLPTRVIGMLRELPFTGPVHPNQLDTVAQDLVDVIQAETSNFTSDWPSRARLDAEVPDRCTGLDGVQMDLGPSWQRSSDGSIQG
jgi:hypothetical protein